MAQKLLILCCGIIFCLSIQAKPISHAKHLVLARGSMAHLLSSVVEESQFDGKYTLHKRIPQENGTAHEGTWIVLAGDTGNTIAQHYGISFDQLATLNPSTQWENLQIGQKLKVPCNGGSSSPQMYVVQGGDTGDKIAAAYGITFSQLSAVNPDVNWYNLQIGQVLVVPASSKSRFQPIDDGLGPMVDMSIPALASTTFDDGLYHPSSATATSQSSTSSTVTESSPTIIAVPPTPVGDRPVSPFLIPGNPNNTTSTVRLRLIRTEQILQTPTYKVVSGDTGYAISAVHGISFDQLSAANPGVVWTNLQIGQSLNLPGPNPARPISPPDDIPLNRRPPHSPPRDMYTLYSGTPSTASPRYPSMQSWLSMSQLWSLNAANIGTSCVFPSGTVPPNTNSESLALKAAIRTVASESGISPAFILAMVLQESNGCVRAPTTSSWEGIRNPGLMQSFRGNASCNAGGEMTQPCPDDTIMDMVREGVMGVQDVGVLPAMKLAAKQLGKSWPLKSVRKQRGVDDTMVYYSAARIYNSGGLPADGDLSGQTGSTRCYVSDVVNRLLGWVNAPKACSLV